MNKTAVIRALIEATSTDPIIFTTGYSCRIARNVADRPNHFYMTGSMGLAASIGTGIALSTGRLVVVVDGDGALAMNPGCLLTAGALPTFPSCTSSSTTVGTTPPAASASRRDASTSPPWPKPPDTPASGTSTT